MNISDIARLAGVSKGTVSRVINNSKEGVSEETRRRIQQIIKETGYIPNQVAGSLTYSCTKTIGLIIPDIQNMFFPQLVRGIEDCANENGYNLFLCNSDSDIKKEERYLRAFIEKRVDGILLNTCGNIQDEPLLKSIIRSNTPIVLLDRRSADFPANPGIYVNNMEAAYDGVSYLIYTGCRKILFLGGPRGVFTSTERYKGYIKALKDAKLDFNLDYVLFGPYSSAFGYSGAKQLLEKNPDVDGIFASSDAIAFGVIRALHEMEIKVPGQISVVGFDGISFSSDISPSLTTVAQPIYEIGYHAVKKLIACINHEENVEDEYMQTSLIVRESTRQIREE